MCSRCAPYCSSNCCCPPGAANTRTARRFSAVHSNEPGPADGRRSALLEEVLQPVLHSLRESIDVTIARAARRATRVRGRAVDVQPVRTVLQFKLLLPAGRREHQNRAAVLSGAFERTWAR